MKNKTQQEEKINTDNISTEEPKTPEQLQHSVRSYFTKDIQEQINEMSAKEMESLMKDLPNNRHWIAILKYTSMRTPLLDSTLRGTDPTKDSHKNSAREDS